MNDYEDYYKSTLELAYSEINSIREFHNETDKIRNNACVLLKVEDRPRIRSESILSQDVSLEDFGISEME